MGSVYKETYTKPIPPGAELFTRKGERLARWTAAKGRTRTARVTITGAGAGRLQLEAGTYTAKYRDGQGNIVRAATGCRDETAAKAVLARLMRRAELVKADVMTAAQDSVADHQATPISGHLAAYLTSLKTKRKCGRVVSAKHVVNVEHNLNRIIAGCGFERLKDLTRAAAEKWMSEREAEGMAARTINANVAALTAFANWCVDTHRLVSNPFARMGKAD